MSEYIEIYEVFARSSDASPKLLFIKVPFISNSRIDEAAGFTTSQPWMWAERCSLPSTGERAWQRGACVVGTCMARRHAWSGVCRGHAYVPEEMATAADGTHPYRNAFLFLTIDSKLPC